MKQTFLAATAAAVLGAAIALIFAPQGAVASGADSGVRVVDLESVVAKSSAAKSVVNRFQNFQKSEAQRLQKLEQEIQGMAKKLGPSPSQNDVQKYAAKVQAAQQEIQKAQMNGQQKLVKMQLDVLKALRPTIKKYAQSNGVGIVLDKNTGAVVYSDNALDVTGGVKAITK